MARGPTMFDKMDFPKYTFREYPKMLYAKGGRTTVVHSAEGEEKLVGDWFTTPGEAAAYVPSVGE